MSSTIELYQLPHFGGMVVPLMESVPDLDAIAFDAPMSLKAKSGIWAVYSEINYQGSHAIINPGGPIGRPEEILWTIVGRRDDAKRKARAAVTISSVKLLKGQIVLYSGTNYSGKHISLTESAPRLSAFSFNDRASSVRVISGTWQLYQNNYYEGASFTTSGSAYSPIPRIPSRSLSSVKFIPEVAKTL